MRTNDSISRRQFLSLAGGIAAGLHVGDVVIGSAAVQHDFDLTPVGYVRGHIEGPDREKPTLFAADAELAEHLRRALRG